MKLTCTQENLNFGLQTTGHLVNKNVNLPILNNVLLEAKGGVLKLSSTNLEIGISAQVRCKVDKEGSFTVEARLLSDYINLLPKDQVRVELKEVDLLNVVCGHTETDIKGLKAEDFPVIPKMEKQTSYRVKATEFKKSLSQVVFAVSPSDTRPEISGVFMDFHKANKGKLILVGTDSYRLAEKSLKLEGNQEERIVIVPVKTLQELLRILSNLKDQSNQVEDIEIYLSENQIMFSLNGVELISRLIEGQYPDYKQIIPQNFQTKVVANTSELIKTIKTVALFSKTGIFDISLIFNPDKGLTIKAVNIQTGESTAVVDVAFQGEKNETVLNYRYLLEGLNNLDAEEVEISVVDNNVPCLIRPKDSSEYLYLVMPIKQ